MKYNKNDIKFVSCIDTKNDTRKISANEAKQILQDNGLVVSQQEAIVLLDFLYRFAVFSLEHINSSNHENS
jgi:hypothetical protein